MVKCHDRNLRPILAVVFLLLSSRADSWDARDSIDAVRAVADKIIRESSFSFQMAPQKSVSGIQAIDFRNEMGTTGPAVGYAFSTMVSPKDASVLVGVGGSESVKIWINSALVYHKGFKQNDGPREIAYDMFSFPDTFRVHLLQGQNPVLVKVASAHRPWNFFLRVINTETNRELDVSFGLKSVVSQNPDQAWMCIGPFEHRGSADQLCDMVLPPETHFEDHYLDHGRTMVWQLPKRPVLPQFTIPVTNSFKSHSYLEWQYANGETYCRESKKMAPCTESAKEPTSDLIRSIISTEKRSTMTHGDWVRS